MAEVKKTLLYYLWIPKDFSDKEQMMYNIHLRCLRYYSAIFSDAVFIVAMDTPDDESTYHSVVKDIASIGFSGNISITKTENNSFYREGEYVKKLIVDKAAEIDGLVFFAHSKGMYNISHGASLSAYTAFNEESITRWVCALYFFNLNFMNEVLSAMGDGKIVFGALLNKYKTDDKPPFDTGWQFNGSFYWINPKRLANYLQYHNLKTPELDNRLYAEDWMRHIIPFDFRFISTRSTYYIDTDKYGISMYLHADEFIKAISGEANDFEKYNNFLKIIIDK